MIPPSPIVQTLWDRYSLPQYKRHHCTLVATVAVYLATQLQKKGYEIDIALLEFAALVHDIDKNIPLLQGEHHPDAGVRVLQKEGYEGVARIVKKHSLPAILDPMMAPTTWEEKLLYLADKMVKQDIITVDIRFALWRAESLPAEAVVQLDQAYPKVKALEKELFDMIGIIPDDIAGLART
jgi:putative nucleotidyltransferase with HDIG domain